MSKLPFRFAQSAVLLTVTVAVRLVAQDHAQQARESIDSVTRSSVIEAALTALKENYVFPEMAERMAQAIRTRQQQNEYESISDPQKLAETLTGNLREVSRDKHLRVYYSATGLPPRATARPSPREINFGFERVERLAGNIGYLDLRVFIPPVAMGETAVAAMNFLANADALIMDLRENTGGAPGGVALIASYLIGPESVRLNDIYDRRSNETRQFWTFPYVPGKRLTSKDVYVLTSARTFSAAEDLAYTLKNLKRATIVGEVTGGGAHPVAQHRIGDHFFIAVPWGRSISPITQTDWEGVGVEPDIKVPAAQALAAAHLRALEKRLPDITEPPMKSEITVAIERLKKELAR